MRAPLATAAAAGTLIAGLFAGTPLRAADRPPQPPSPPGCAADQLLCDAIQRLVDALGQVIENVPRYAPPEIDPDGNIILRRLNPPAPAPLRREPPTWDFDQAAT